MPCTCSKGRFVHRGKLPNNDAQRAIPTVTEQLRAEIRLATLLTAANARVLPCPAIFPKPNECAHISCNERSWCPQSHTADCALRVGHRKSHHRDGRESVGPGDTSAKRRFQIGHAMPSLGRLPPVQSYPAPPSNGSDHWVRCQVAGHRDRMTFFNARAETIPEKRIFAEPVTDFLRLAYAGTTLARPLFLRHPNTPRTAIPTARSEKLLGSGTGSSCRCVLGGL